MATEVLNLELQLVLGALGSSLMQVISLRRGTN